jgi:galactokinase
VIALRALESGFRDLSSLPPELVGKREALLRLLALFAERYGRGQGNWQVFAAFVPGRVELLGKHTDYAGGHSLLAVLDRGYLVLARANDCGRVRIVEDSREFEPVDFPVSPELDPPIGSWGNYPMTAVKRAAANFGTPALRGMDVAFSSDLAVGSGMSGSSALIIMTFAALAAVNRLAERPAFRESIRNGIDLAMYLACAENGRTFRALAGGRGVGTFGGSEDHTSILNARPGCLSLYRFAPTVWRADLAWPDEWSLAVCFSGVRAEKTREALEKYNRLSARAGAVVEEWNRATGSSLATLREVAEAAAGTSEPEADDPLPAATRVLARSIAYPSSTWDLPGRLRQFRIEDRRYIPEAVQAVLAGDGGSFGAVACASHEASRRYLGNIAPEIDFLSSSARELGAWGASGFGAGFGGSAYAVLPSADAPAFLDRWKAAYASRWPARHKEAWFLLTRPVGGLTELSLERPARWVDGLWL